MAGGMHGRGVCMAGGHAWPWGCMGGACMASQSFCAQGGAILNKGGAIISRGVLSLRDTVLIRGAIFSRGAT